ncbi:MAG TPA: cytochrome c [Polyangiaceae bacterium]|nr:cytochrome c [Polyangiaceae bacterium]
MRTLTILCASLVVWTAGGCRREEPSSGGDEGARIYARACSSCHGMDGRGRPRMGLTTPPRDLTDPELYRNTNEAGLQQVVLHGKGQMPAFSKLLDEQEVRAVIGYLHTLQRKP